MFRCTARPLRLLQAALLRRMIDAEIDAVLVKIAAAGLTPQKHLGAHLASLPAQASPRACACAPSCHAAVYNVCLNARSNLTTPPTHLALSAVPRFPALQLHALRRLYGSNVCGEGGEYETLTLDCPLFTHGRIVLDSWQAVMLSDDSMAPVALLHPTAFHVEPKQPAGEGASSGGGASGSAAEEEAAAGCVIEVPADWMPHAAPQPTAGAAAENAAAEEQADAALDVQLGMADGSQHCSLTASVAPAGAGTLDLASAAGTAAALSAALRRLSAALPALGLSWQSSLFVHLYVPSMAQFAAANAAYAAFLPAVNPPSRATVQLSGGSGLALVVEVLFTR